MTTVSAQRLAKVFVEVADTLVDEFDLIEFLHMLADRVAALVDASAVGLLLADQRGHLQFMAASQESVRLLELFQVQNDEGPCLDCVRTGAPVIAKQLADTSRWPVFARAATSHGYHTVTAIPMRLRSETIGGINLFSTRSQSIDETCLRIAQALADIATIGILQQRSIHRASLLAEQLQAALNTRISIEQAKGVLAERGQISMTAAYQQLRTYARNNNLKLTLVAEAVASGNLPADQVIGMSGPPA